VTPSSWSFIALLPDAIHGIGGGPLHYRETGGAIYAMGFRETKRP
jgi:hypothetical protein